MPKVAQPRAIVGDIQCIDEYEVHPNQNNPAGIAKDSMQTKYNRPSGVLVILPSFLATRSWKMLTSVARTDPTHIA